MMGSTSCSNKAVDASQRSNEPLLHSSGDAECNDLPVRLKSSTTHGDDEQGSVEGTPTVTSTLRNKEPLKTDPCSPKNFRKPFRPQYVTSTLMKKEPLKTDPGSPKNFRKPFRPQYEDTEPWPRISFHWYDVLIAIAGLMLYIFDIYSDIRLAVVYFREGHVRYGAVTLTFVVLAYITTTVYALLWYYLCTDYIKLYRAPRIMRCCRNPMTLLMLGPVVRYLEYVYNGYKARTCTEDKVKQKEYTNEMTNHHVLNSTLAMFEACIEAAPQLVFQLYVLLVAKPQLEGVDGVWRAFTILSSWFSLTLALTTFKKSERNRAVEDTRHTFRHQAFDLLWRLPETGGRVLCIACFASVFRFYVLAVVIPHILILVVWQYLKERSKHVRYILLHFVFSGAFLFAFFRLYLNFRLQSIAFYLLFYIENFTMLLLWYFYTPDQGAWFHTPILIAGFVSLPLHVLLQSVYYKRCHPSSDSIKTCIDCGWEKWRKALFSKEEDD